MHPIFPSFLLGVKSTKVQVNLDSQQEDANESKVKKGMNQYGCSTRLKVAKLHAPMSPRHLKEQARS